MIFDSGDDKYKVKKNWQRSYKYYKFMQHCMQNSLLADCAPDSK